MKAYVRSGLVIAVTVLAAVAIASATPPSYSARASVLLRIYSDEHDLSGDQAALISEAFASSIALTESDSALAPAAALVGLPLDTVRQMVTESAQPDSLILDITTVSRTPATTAAVSNSVAYTMSSIGVATANGPAYSSVVRTAPAPTDPIPTPWPTVLFSGFVAGVIIAFALTIASRRKPG